MDYDGYDALLHYIFKQVRVFPRHSTLMASAYRFDPTDFL